MTSLGWIYVITCKMYDKENIKKIGFTEKMGLLEEDVRSSLLQRYGTTLINPRILYLIKVSNPRKAEKKIFELLEKFRVEKEIFKVDVDQISSAIRVLCTEFPPEYSGMTRDTLEKLLCKLRRRDKKIARDLSYQQQFSNWIINNKNICNFQNQQNITYLVNNMINPVIISTNFDWTKRPENQNALSSRISIVNSTFQPNNWDCSDPSLHKFLKRLIDSV